MSIRNLYKHCLQRPQASPLRGYEVYQINFKGAWLQSNDYSNEINTSPVHCNQKKKNKDNKKKTLRQE